MATKTIALKIDVQDAGKISQLEQNLVKLSQRKSQLNKLVREGTTLTDKEAKELGELGTQAQATRNKINDLKNGILKQNDALKKNSGFVAGVRKGVGQWATSMIGVTAAIAAGTRIIGNMVQVVTDFSKSTSTLASVLGTTKENIKDLTDQAKELGATTAFTASEVVELQTEFAKLGFPTEDIKNMTASTLDAAAALGSELGEQAALTGAVLKGYGLDSEEAARVNDVLAKSASSSALDFSKLSTALPIVGATAKTAGVSLERTTALLGTLSDRGIDASTAATSLRNIFLELSKKGLTFEQAMSQINNATDKNAVAMDLFGKRSATAGIIIAESGMSIDNLEKSLINAEGAAQEMADTMLDNLAGDMTKAQSAWEGFILSLEDGEGVFSEISRSLTQSLTDVLDTLTKLNSGDLTAIGIKNIEGMDEAVGNLNITFGELTAAAEQDEGIFNALNDAYKNGTISVEKYEAGIKKLADGYKRGVKEVKESEENLLSIQPEDGQVTESEKQTIESKIKTIKDLQDAARKRIAEEQANQLQDEEIDEEGDLDTLLDMEVEKNENLLAIDQEYLDQKAAQREEDINAEIAAEQRRADEIKQIEEAKKNARLESLNIVAGALDAFSKFAKEGSAEQKALASASTLVSTYLSAQQAYASQFLPIPTPSSPIRATLAAGVAVAQGLARVKQINSVKAAKGMYLQEGGMINGASHANGGVPFTVGGQAGFEAEGGEAIINKRSTSLFKPLLSAINEAGGGVAFARGGLVSKFQNGGMAVSSNGVTAAQQSFSSGIIDTDELAGSIGDQINQIEVVNVATNTSDVATEVINIQNEATF